jgi:dCTP deaminase
MILTGSQIASAVAAGDITLEPYLSDQVTTNSYDLRLGDELLRYTDEILDPFRPPTVERITIPAEGLVLPAGSFHLGSSVEVVGSDRFVPLIHAKSGVARLGLFVHCTADLIDIGSRGNVTFQLHATLPVRVYPRMLVGQVTFWVPKGEIVLYSGKYQGSRGPQPSRSWQDRDSR